MVGKDRHTHTHTQREDGHVNMEAIGVTLPQTKEHLGPPNQEETRKVPLLEASEGTQPCRHYDYGLLLPRTWEKINLCYFKPPSSQHSIAGCPWKLFTTPLLFMSTLRKQAPGSLSKW